jgi:hypothetical protein
VIAVRLPITRDGERFMVLVYADRPRRGYPSGTGAFYALTMAEEAAARDLLAVKARAA